MCKLVHVVPALVSHVLPDRCILFHLRLFHDRARNVVPLSVELLLELCRTERCLASFPFCVTEEEGISAGPQVLDSVEVSHMNEFFSLFLLPLIPVPIKSIQIIPDSFMNPFLV